MGNVALEVRTLESGKHSGQYGGAAADALLALLHANRDHERGPANPLPQAA